MYIPLEPNGKRSNASSFHCFPLRSRSSLCLSSCVPIRRRGCCPLVALRLREKKKQNVFPLHSVCSCPVNPANASTFFLWAWEEQNGPAVVLATCGSLATSVERQGRNRLCEPILFAQGIENEERPRTASERFRRSR